jgi:hypothetical protein
MKPKKWLPLKKLTAEFGERPSNCNVFVCYRIKKKYLYLDMYRPSRSKTVKRYIFLNTKKRLISDVHRLRNR